VIRDQFGDQIYWEKTTARYKEQINRAWNQILYVPSANPAFEPEYVFRNSQNRLRSLLALYSKGEVISKLRESYVGILEAWELSDKIALSLKETLSPGEGWDHRHALAAPSISSDPRSNDDPRAWIFRLSDLNHYNWCFWLVALALLLEVPDEDWQRLIVLIGEAGNDVLLDRVMATRQTDRIIGTTLLHHKPYARLLASIEAHTGQRAEKLFAFVNHWYVELDRKGNDELWWYVFADPAKHSLEKGSYFGRWCLEAAAVAKVFGIDDSLCLGHESYPGDFLRPEGHSTHLKIEQKKQSFWRRFFPS